MTLTSQEIFDFGVFEKAIFFFEFGDYIWTHHVICIQISTNMPGIDVVFCEIGCEI